MKVWVIEKDGDYLDKRTGQKTKPSFGPLTGWCCYGSRADAQQKVKSLSSRRNPILGLQVKEVDCEFVERFTVGDFEKARRKSNLPDNCFCTASSEYGYIRSLNPATYTGMKPPSWFGGKVKVCKTPEEFYVNFILLQNLLSMSDTRVMSRLTSELGSVTEARKQLEWGKAFLAENAILEVYRVP